MGAIGRGRGEHHFGVGGDLQLARARPVIADSEAPRLGVVLGRDDYLEDGLDRSIHSCDACAVLAERDFIAVGLNRERLQAGGPHGTGARVAQEDERAPAIAGRVFAPASHVQALAPAVAAARGGQHHRVAAVAQQMRRRAGQPGAVEHTSGRRHHAELAGRRLGRARDARLDDAVRGPFLQQQIGGFHQRMAMEAPAHRGVAQRVADRHQRHPLVVRHVRSHHLRRAALRQPGRRVVERLVPPVRAQSAGPLQPVEILSGGGGVVHRGQRGGVGCDHQVFLQAALESQLRHTERRILIGQGAVPPGVCGLGDAPRHAPRARHTRSAVRRRRGRSGPASYGWPCK